MAAALPANNETGSFESLYCLTSRDLRQLWH
jgi:hypothetical protein